MEKERENPKCGRGLRKQGEESKRNRERSEIEAKKGGERGRERETVTESIRNLKSVTAKT